MERLFNFNFLGKGEPSGPQNSKLLTAFSLYTSILIEFRECIRTLQMGCLFKISLKTFKYSIVLMTGEFF
jgi:hypothetical protein